MRGLSRRGVLAELAGSAVARAARRSTRPAGERRPNALFVSVAAKAVRAHLASLVS